MNLLTDAMILAALCALLASTTSMLCQPERSQPTPAPPLPPAIDSDEEADALPFGPAPRDTEYQQKRA